MDRLAAELVASVDEANQLRLSLASRDAEFQGRSADLAFALSEVDRLLQLNAASVVVADDLRAELAASRDDLVTSRAEVDRLASELVASMDEANQLRLVATSAVAESEHLRSTQADALASMARMEGALAGAQAASRSANRDLNQLEEALLLGSARQSRTQSALESALRRQSELEAKLEGVERSRLWRYTKRIRRRPPSTDNAEATQPVEVEGELGEARHV